MAENLKTLNTETLKNPVNTSPGSINAQQTKGLVTIYIPSHHIEVRSRKVDGKQKKFIYGAINSVPFELPCDEPIQVEAHIAEHLEPYIKR